jgi:phage-related tail protein
MRDSAAWLEMTKWSLDRNEYTPKVRRFMKGVSAILRKNQDLTAAQVKWAVSIWESAKVAGFRP